MLLMLSLFLDALDALSLLMLSLTHTHSLTQSLTHSLSHTLSHTLTHSLTRVCSSLSPSLYLSTNRLDEYGLQDMEPEEILNHNPVGLGDEGDSELQRVWREHRENMKQHAELEMGDDDVEPQVALFISSLSLLISLDVSYA